MKAPTLSLAFLLACAPVAPAQPPSSKPLSFEVASIKPHPFTPGVGGGLRITGSIVTVTNYPLRTLILLAYGVSSYQLEGGPAWMSDPGESWYDINAKVAGDVTPTMDQAKQMMQALLTERFHLQLRRELRSTSSYGLMVAKNGPKMKPSAPDTAFGANFSPGLMVASKMNMQRLALSLSAQVENRPVIDKTGLSGEYDIRLESRDIGFGTAPDASGSTLFTALEEQLGLRLVSEKDPIEYVTIEHIEKPSEN